jgi:hypothetical protein
LYYFAAEISGALLASLFVRYFIGTEAHLGANSFNHSYPVLAVFGTEVLALALLMAVILTVVYTKGLRGFSGVAIGGIVGLDIFFLSNIFWCFNESCSFIGIRFIIWKCKWLVALLVGYICGNYYRCIFFE